MIATRNGLNRSLHVSIFNYFIFLYTLLLSRPHTINLYDGVGQLTDYRRSVDSLSGFFQLDFVVYDASDGFRRRPIRFKK